MPQLSKHKGTVTHLWGEARHKERGGGGVLRRLTSRSENKNQNRTVTFVSWLCDHDFRLKQLRKNMHIS